MKSTARKLFFAAVVAAAVGCGGTEPNTSDPADGRDDSFAISDGRADGLGVEEGSPDALAVLEVANERSLQELDGTDGVGLDARAARNIVDYRLKDPVDPDDDVTIDTLRELDSIPWVGPRAFELLLDYARIRSAAGAGSAGTATGVDDGEALTCTADYECSGRCLFGTCYEWHRDSFSARSMYGEFHAVMRPDGGLEALRPLKWEPYDETVEPFELSGEPGAWTTREDGRVGGLPDVWIGVSPNGEVHHYPKPFAKTAAAHSPEGALAVAFDHREDGNWLHWFDEDSWVEENLGRLSAEVMSPRFNAESEAEVLGTNGPDITWHKRQAWGGWSREVITTFPRVNYRQPRARTVHAPGGVTHLFLQDTSSRDNEGTLHVVMDDTGVISETPSEFRIKDGWKRVYGPELGPNGEFYAVTELTDGDYRNFELLRSDDGVEWESAPLLNEDRSVSEVQFLVGNDGRLSLVWTEFRYLHVETFLIERD